MNINDKQNKNKMMNDNWNIKQKSKTTNMIVKQRTHINTTKLQQHNKQQVKTETSINT